jgi:hypothetical protein
MALQRSSPRRSRDLATSPSLCFALMLPRGLASARAFHQLLLHFCESPLPICRLNRTQLEIQKGCQASSDSRVNPAGIEVRDQPSHRVPHRKRIVQGWQRGRVFAEIVALASAPDPAQFGSLVGVGVEKAQAARGGSGPAGLAGLCLGLTTRIKVLVGHFLLQAQRWTESVARDDAGASRSAGAFSLYFRSQSRLGSRSSR